MIFGTSAALLSVLFMTIGTCAAANAYFTIKSIRLRNQVSK